MGHLANYFDSVFCNLRNNGLLCLTSSDISVQFTRTANVIRRYCHAQVTKTDYMREMAVRVIIGSAVRFVFACILHHQFGSGQCVWIAKNLLVLGGHNFCCWQSVDCFLINTRLISKHSMVIVTNYVNKNWSPIDNNDSSVFCIVLDFSTLILFIWSSM